jgi:hypothetical protein
VHTAGIVISIGPLVWKIVSAIAGAKVIESLKGVNIVRNLSKYSEKIT